MGTLTVQVGSLLLLLASAPGQSPPPVPAALNHAVTPPGSNPRALYLSAETVDLTSAASLLDDPNATLDPAAHYVIQLDGPINPVRRTAIEGAGLKLGQYLPMYAYIVRGDSMVPAALRNLGFVRWVGDFQTTWKIHPALGNANVHTVFETPERQQLDALNLKRLTIDLFDGADLAIAMRGILSEAAVVNDVEPFNEECKIELDAPPDAVARLAALNEVRFIAEAGEAIPRNASTACVNQSNMTNVTPLWDAGLHGENQFVGLIDWDLDETHCSFSDVIPPGPSHRKIIEYYNNYSSLGGNAYHGTYTGCILAGSEVSMTNADLRGQAYAAKLVVQNFLNNITTSNFNDRLLYSSGFGAHVHSNSWGNNDNFYNNWCHDIDLFMHDNEDDLVVIAILNGTTGSLVGSIRAPENAKNCLSVAAAGDAGNQEFLGSGAKGPTADGRRKPEVLISGCPAAASVGTACSVIQRTCATSWSAPSAAAMATLARQYFVEGYYPSGQAQPSDTLTPTGALLKAVLVNAAVDMTGIAGYYGYQEGYGRVLMDDALHFTGESRKLIVHDVRHADGLSTGESIEYGVNVLGSAQRLKITLAWSDAPAAVSASFAPINNLNLIVTDPNNNIYRGNAFDVAESTTLGAADPLNNTEQVLRSNPTPGAWTIAVEGAAVSVGTQGYALVITGEVEEVVQCLKGDVTGDGEIDGEDIPAFVSVLLNGGTPRELCAADVDEMNGAGPDDVGPFAALLLGVTYCPRPRGDINGDMMVDGADVQGFTDVLIGGGTAEEWCAADFDGSDASDLSDLPYFLTALLGPES